VFAASSLADLVPDLNDPAGNRDSSAHVLVVPARAWKEIR